MNDERMKNQTEIELQNINPSEILEEKEKFIVLNNVLKTLDPREQKIIKQIYWGGKTHSKIAKSLNLGRGRVGQILKVAMNPLNSLLK
jgi:RNA polymerase sigma factor (sigma-70 family)